MASLSPSDQVRQMYRMQLKKFYRLGVGNKTEFGTIVTDRLIDITKRRLDQLNDQCGIRPYKRRAA